MPERAGWDERQVDLRLETILSRFPERYDDEQVAKIREHIETAVDHARSLHAVELSNGDEPAGAFTPYRAGAS